MFVEKGWRVDRIWFISIRLAVIFRLGSETRLLWKYYLRRGLRLRQSWIYQGFVWDVLLY